MTDVWTSGGVLAGLAVIMFAPRWHILDPIVAIAVALRIVATGFDLLRRTVDGLMDAAMPTGEIDRTRHIIEAMLPPGTSYHGLRTRKAGSRRFIEFHLLVPGRTTVRESHAWCDGIEAAIAERLQRTSVTIHVEPAETEAP
jgi:cation diffusion facilitator family transporter